MLNARDFNVLFGYTINVKNQNMYDSDEILISQEEVFYSTLDSSFKYEKKKKRLETYKWCWSVRA